MNRNSVRLACGYKDFFFYRILSYIVIIDSDADFSFVYAAAHIAAYRKYGIPFSVHIQQLDSVIRTHITYIRILNIRKTKYQGSLVCLLIVIPQFIRRHKRHRLAVFIHQILNILRHDSQDNPPFIQHMLRRVEDLFHRPVVIQQIGLIRPLRMAHTEKLLGQIDIRLILFPFTPDAVFQLNRERVILNLLDIPTFSLLYCRF